MRYFKPSKVDVEIPAIRFEVKVHNEWFKKDAVKCIAKGPFLADFTWNIDQECWECDRLYLKKGRVRLDDVPGFRPLLAGASYWADSQDLGGDEWEAVA